MSHHPDMQKEAIFKSLKHKNKSELAAQFEAILHAPDYSSERRKSLLMQFAWSNRHEIIEGLGLRNSLNYSAEQSA